MKLKSLALAFTLGSIGLLAPRDASAQQLRFSTNAPGRLIGTGNTLGLSKQMGKNGPGTADSIGTFISLDPSSMDLAPNDGLPPWGANTTNDWTKNGSNAVLTLPGEVPKVLYAELVWGGSTNYGGEDVTSFLDSSVTLTAGGSSMAINPDPSTAVTVSRLSTSSSGGSFMANYYMRSANVTQFVQQAGGGTYSLQGVPATQSETIDTLNAAGWTLVVVVRDESQPVRNLSVFVGGSFVDENSTQDYTVNGFCTPPSGPFAGHVVISAIEGDANRTGDQLLIAPTTAGPFVNLSGPNNPQQNFFCSQINGSDGMLDTSGSFGTANADPVSGADVSGGRQGWDITTVGVSSQAGQLINGQKSAVLRTITTGDSFMPIVAAFAIDVNAPVFSTAATQIKTDKSVVTNGDSLTVSLDLSNSGSVAAQNVLLTLPLQSGLSLTSYTTDGAMGDINGAPVNQSALGAGVAAGTLQPGQTRHIVVGLKVTGAPPGGSNMFALSPQWGYAYVICTGGAATSETFSEIASVTYTSPTSTTAATTGATTGTTSAATTGATTGATTAATTTSGAGTTTGAGNGTGTGAGTTGAATTGVGTGAGGANTTGAGGSSGSGAGVTQGKGGCGCSIPGDDQTPWSIGFAAAGLAALALRRRRK